MGDSPIGPDFAGLVLAGGASRRMGQDKALLVHQGKTLLDHAISRLITAGADPVLVSGHRPSHEGIPDQEPGLGPLGGLASVIDARPGLMGRLLLLMPVDTPGLAAHSLRRLVAAARDNAQGAHFEGHPLPMALYLSKTFKQALRTQLMAQQQRSAKQLAKTLSFAALDPMGHDLSNLNTPDAWRAFQEVGA